MTINISEDGNTTISDNVILWGEDIRNYKKLFILPLFLLALSITILNSCVLLAYKRMHFNQKSTSNYLLSTTALADLYIGMITWFEVVVHSTSRDTNHVVHAVYKGVLEYSYTLSLANLFICALERYSSVCLATYHRCHVTKSRVMIGTLIVWLLSAIPPVILLTLSFFTSGVGVEREVMTWYSFIFDGVMLVLICSSVSIVLVTLKSARNLIRPKQQTIHQDTTQRLVTDVQQRKEFRLVLIFVMMITAYVITYLPVTVGRILYDVGGLRHLNRFEGVVMLSLCQALYKSSALFNPVLTFTLRDDFRNVLITSVFNIKQRRRMSRRTSDGHRHYSRTTYV